MVWQGHTTRQNRFKDKICLGDMNCVRVSHVRKTLESTLLINFINTKLSPKKGIHASSMTANLQLNIAGKTLNTETTKK